MSVYLDTAFLIDIIQNNKGAVSLLEKLSDSIQFTGSINVHEFLVGAYGSNNEKKELQSRRKVLNKLFILSFDQKSAEESAIIEGNLRKEGNFIGTADILIAGIMKSNGIKTIVTNNSKHFEKIEDLEILTY